jgi:chitodextrinase
VSVGGATSAQAAVAPQLTRYPYLSDLVGGYVTVNWATNRSDSVGSVSWGRMSSGTCTPSTPKAATRSSITVNGVLQYQWSAQLALATDTEYCYRVFLGMTDLLASDPTPTFKTQVGAGNSQAFSFAVLGDSGVVDVNGQNPHMSDLMTSLASSDVRFAVSTGDLSNLNGDQKNFGDLYQVGAATSAFFGPQFWAKVGHRIPLFTTSGNHGVTNSTLLSIFPQSRAVLTSGGTYAMQSYGPTVYGTTTQTQQSAWYAFDAGPARFYVLKAAWSDGNQGTAPGAHASQKSYANDFDAHWKPGKPEYEWLANDLASHPNAVKFAFFHYPLYSLQDTESSNTYLQGQNSIEGLLSAHGVDIVFNGHAHIYERNVRSLGVVSYVSGGGGAVLQSFKTCQPFAAYAIGWSNTNGAGTRCGSAPMPASKANVYHYIKVTVIGRTITVAPTNSLGQTFDVQIYDAGNPTTDPTPPTAPTNLAGTSPNTSSVSLTWTAATDNVRVVGYNVYRGGSTQPIGTVTTTSFTETNLAPNTGYSYYVRAFDGAGNASPPSSTVTVTTQNGPLSLTPTNDSTIDPATTTSLLSRLKVDLTTPRNDMLLKFALPVGCAPSSAQLRLTAGNGVNETSVNGGRLYATSKTDPNAGWTEGNVTWSSAPAIDTNIPPVTIAGAIAADVAYTVNVLSLVPSSGGIFTLRGSSPSGDGAAYYSKEGGAAGPRLAVTC